MDSSLFEHNLRGLRQVRIPRYGNGFGFTLRHFIVYPPDVCEKTGETQSRFGKVTEPVDTIFVKSVREDGPAFQAGLCVGDRIVSVNGERVVGRSYDQVVHRIQNSPHAVFLEVSPKQYDTLQLFYEDKAYRPETNQRPTNHQRSIKGQGLSHSQSLEFYQPLPPPRTTYPPRLPPPFPYETLPHESIGLRKKLFQRNQNYYEEIGMSSAYPNQQPIISHLPRPPPYKSTTNWSHLNPSPQSSLSQSQPQTYYPFHPQQDFQEFKSDNSSRLWGIREEGTKSSESVLEGSSGSLSNSNNSNRYGSMECLSNNTQQPITWKNSPGYRFSISTGPGNNHGGTLDSFRRDTTNQNLGGPPGGFVSPTNQNQEMIVTMSGGLNEMPDYGLSERSGNPMRGYEMKMADRIRRNTEQKEEFLRRPNQPLQWAPVQSTTSVGSPIPFAKEFYAQPQKFQKVPWPPENRILTITTPIQPQQSNNTMVTSSDTLMTVSMRNQAMTPKQVTTNQKGHMDKMEHLRLSATYGGSLDETTSRRLESVSNKLVQQQSFPKSSGQLSSEGSNLAVSDAAVLPGRNRVTLVGSGKVHCDPPKGWKHPSISLHETENTHLTNADTDVILRKRDADPESENERLVRRVSYLKATSSPIDMDRKNSSPTTPTKSPSSEFRQFGSFPSDKSPDSTEVIREGQVHFKVRAGDAKKGGYYRSWRQGWAQIRRSGCLYFSKERLTKETISGTEADVILCIGLKDGVTIDYADDYTKRKNVLRMRTSSSVPTTVGENPHVPIPVEILIQGDDPLETTKWVQTLQQQQDNNNSLNSPTTSPGGVRINPIEMSSPRSLLRTFLTTPQIQAQTTILGQSMTTSSIGNYLTPVGPPILTTSPKNKTWKGRVVKQWKKIHSTTPSSPLQSQGSIPESGATFGVGLEECPQSDTCLVPRILEYCIELVERRGLSVVGIYRIPGNNAAISALTESLNKGNEINPELDQRWTDVHVISSLLKSFLRKLPDPLLTSARYPDFIKGAAEPEPEKALERIRSLVHDLPDTNYETLRHLILHLKKVAENSERNRMEPRNLAIVFGPTVVRTAEENFDSLVTDMQHQCKIVELLINNADDIFKEKEDSPTPPEETDRFHQPNRYQGLANSSPPKIEIDIRTSLIQAAQRKKYEAQKPKTPAHNTYGLPPHPFERDRSVDESGHIRSYAGLGEETEERVRQFEMETRAHLYRETRSPGLPAQAQKPQEKLVQEKLRLEAEWRKAKEDLENEDFYDQLADNPSTIVEHRVPYGITMSSSSSISSTKSSGMNGSNLPPFGTWPVRLGPVPFKSQFPTEKLPPKPPQFPPPSAAGLRKAPPTPPLRKTISNEKLSLLNDKAYMDGFVENTESSGKLSDKGNFKVLKNTETENNSLHYDSRVFGSLDSLQNLTNGSRENLSTDGSDLVSSLSKTLDEKMERLKNENTSLSRTEVNGGQKVEEGRWDRELILGKRRNSLVENRRKIGGERNGIQENQRKGNLEQRPLNNESGSEGSNGHVSSVKVTKIVSEKQKKNSEIQRRHSLSGTVDILRFVLSGDTTKRSSHRHSDIHLSTEGLATALTANNILESQV